MKNIPKIEIRIIIGYSNLSILLSQINDFDEFRTNKLEIRINNLKNCENESLIKLSENIFSTLFEELKIITIVVIITIEDKLKIKLKLCLINTPSIKILNIDNVKKISGNKMFKLLIISC